MKPTGEANHGPKCSKAVSPQSSTSTYWRREQIWESMALKNGLSKVDSHFSLLFDGKLPLRLPCSLHHSGYVIFRLRDRIIKFKTHQIKKYSILAEIN